MPDSLTFLSESPANTDQLAGACASAVECGLTLALNGDLGTGKTHFVRSFCTALGVEPSQVSSPTFVLMQLYQGVDWPVSHFDTYRLGDPDEFQAVGAEEYLADEDRICLVEWADRVSEVLPADHVRIEIRATGARHRQFLMTASGPLSQSFLDRVEQSL